MKILFVTLALVVVASAFPTRNLWHNLRSSWVPVNRGDDDKIVGGAATGKAIDYQISLQLLSGGKFQHICGGTIAGPKLIITAAHCVVDFPISQLQVVAGEYDLLNANDQLSAHAVSQKIPHESYSSFTLRNDIALLRLATAISLGGKANRANFTDIQVPNVGTDATVSGWGTLSSGGQAPNVLHKVAVPIVSNSDCTAAYGSQFFSQEMFCAGKAEGGVDSCQGDSGGPIVKGKNFLIGIVSWGYGCAAPGYYGVYTRLSNYAGWAQSKLKSL